MAGAVRRLVARTQQAPWDTARSRTHCCKQQVRRRYSQFRQHLGLRLHLLHSCKAFPLLTSYLVQNQN